MIPTEKQCSRCYGVFPCSFFYRKGTRWHAECKACYRERRKAYVAENAERIKEQNREYSRRHYRKYQVGRYGLTLEEFEQMVANQDGLCAICGSPPTGDHLHIDHCHGSGRVRGLLCGSCNMGLGNFRDSQKLLDSARKYLDIHREDLLQSRAKPIPRTQIQEAA